MRTVLLISIVALAGCQQRETASTNGAPASAGQTPSSATAPLPPVVPPQASTTDPSANAPRISIDEAKEWIEGGRVRVLDVRSADDYRNGHIPTALHIPLSRLEGEIAYLPRDKPILTYCT